jgi:Ca-activated chloride channel family protein
MLPEAIPDLFAGQDLVLLTRYKGNGASHLRFSGRTVNGPISWESDVNFPDRERGNSFVARLWATQRVGYLEAERHKSGPNPEIDDELRTLGQRYGIPTELTSYLVQDQTLAVNRPFEGRLPHAMPVPPGDMATVVTSPSGANSVSRRDVSQMDAMAVTGPVGAGQQFAAAKAASAQRAATTLVAADSIVSADHTRGAMRHVGAHTFVWQDSAWVDTRYRSTTRTIRVQPFSSAYFAVLRALPELRETLALGDHVIVCGGQIAVAVTPSGEADISDSDLAALRAGW